MKPNMVIDCSCVEFIGGGRGKGSLAAFIENGSSDCLVSKQRKI